ncbi:glycosyltransferase [Thermodesulfovibrionales bacterium]|nr:glycosyltransferase [Thermodesulfovibrionales bacterium]
MTIFYRADLHLHSYHSNKSSKWAIRKLNCPESYTSPLFIYDTARKKGMDYVTITDHDSINGALEIAHLPFTFISVEVTSYFPENECEVHVVVLDIDEAILSDITHLRKNIYDLVAYLRKNDITHFVAHPFYSIDGRLSIEMAEKMLLLFDIFETKSGINAKRYNDAASSVISALTPEKILHLANKYNITPYGQTPWKKSIVGGSDDHGGLFIGRAYTATKDGETLKEFIHSIKGGKTWAEGDGGNVLTYAHNLYSTGYRFFKEQSGSKKNSPLYFVETLMNKAFNAEQGNPSVRDKVKFFIKKKRPEIHNDYNNRSFEEILGREAKMLLNDKEFLKTISTVETNKKVFTIMSHLVNKMVYIYTERLSSISLSSGAINLINSLINSVSAIGLIHLFASPYYAAFHKQHKGKQVIKEIEMSFLSAEETGKRQKIALFTDTLNDINGVAITIKEIIKIAEKKDVKLIVINSDGEETKFEDGVMNFKSINYFALPEYPEFKLHFPPILDVIHYIEEEGFTRIHASTPGTLGLLALSISKLMDIPLTGTYHTDVPKYVRSLTGDISLEKIAWKYMVWFYNLMDEVTVPSENTTKELIEKGISAEKIRPLRRWVDTEVFSPAKNDTHHWHKYGLGESTKLLYVGRVSKEKNLELMANAFIEIVDAGSKCHLIIVGDGPYRKELERMLTGYPVLFTGFLVGDELYKIYASSDVFVFPSTTDTFGNVVIEAQASGLPVIVSDKGGPSELIIDGQTGLVIKGDSKEALADSLRYFLSDRNRIQSMGANARSFVENNKIYADDNYGAILYA